MPRLEDLAAFAEVARSLSYTRAADALSLSRPRVAILRDIETTPFFQAVRGDLVVSLYNQKEIWPIFGYEGESYSKGGYIERGFDDITWL